MKKTAILFFLLLFVLAFLWSQDGGWTIDSIFDEPFTEEPEEPDDSLISFRDKFLMEAAYGFIGGFAPGWSEAPWYEEEGEYSYILGARMDALLSMKLALSDVLSVKNSFLFSVPEKDWFTLKEFYFEYNFLDVAFVQAGLCEIAWGISPFFPYTNLPSRIPTSEKTGDAYLGRVRIPIGIGGLELLGLTRPKYLDAVNSPSINEISYGAKYNLAFEGADINAGLLYYKDMPLRFFVSLKTTLGNTELYAEGLAAVSYETWDEACFSGSFGFLKDFFKGSLTLTGEIFYNGEPDSYWWRPKTDILDEDAVDLFTGLNGAMAFIIRPGIIGMRIFGQCLYTYEKESFWLVPGISIKPGDLFTISLSAPMALGRRYDKNENRNYYRSNGDKDDRPFSIVLGITLNRKVRYTL
ncbi:MAG: hypothetical protein FWG27_03390 [Treponema sp.]|nr:hypothetical protein [Treponema sp.]